MLACDVCQCPCDTVTTNKEHVICSPSCHQRLSLGERMRPQQARHEELFQQENILTVKGHGEVSVTPDRVRVTIEIIKRSLTSERVNEMMRLVASALLEYLQKETNKRAEKIQTSNFEIRPVRKDEEHREGPIIAYEAHFNISFEAEVAEGGLLIDRLLDHLHKNSLPDTVNASVESVRYIVSDAISKPAYAEALKLASKDAEAQGTLVLESLGLKKSKVVRIDVQDAGQGVTMREENESYAAYSAKSMMRTPKTQFIAPQNQIEASVTLVIAYE